MSEPITTGYDHMNAEGVPIRLSMDDLAGMVVAQNYGFLRMLAAMCRHMRAGQAADQARFDARGDTDVRVRQPLVDAIEAAIKRGEYS